MANTKIQVKRTSVAGRLPNTTNSGNSSYIDVGEFALNLADGKLFTSNGSLITIGSNVTDVTAETVNADQGTFNNISLDGGIAIGNGSVNASINATALFAGNASVNVIVNTSILSVSNTISNSTISPATIFVGNTLVNTTIDLIGGYSNSDIYVASMSSSGVVTLQTVANHNISLSVQSKVKIQSTSSVVLNSANYTTGDDTFTIKDVPTANTITFTIDRTILGNLGSSYSRNIKSLSRANGVAIVETAANNGLTNGNIIAIQDAVTSKYSFLTTGNTVTTLNTTAFSYPNQLADIVINMSALAWSVAAKTSSSSGDILMTITKSNHGILAGQSVTTTSPLPATITLGTGTAAKTMGLTGTFTVTSVVTNVSFTIKLGVKTVRIGSWGTTTGTFTSGTITRSFNETAVTSGKVYQVMVANSVGGNVVVNQPKGLTIKNGSDLIRITSGGIYVGNTTTGGFTGPTGFKVSKP